MNLLKTNVTKNSNKIESFFTKTTIFTDFCLKAFDSDADLSNHEKSVELLKLWKSFLIMKKVYSISSIAGSPLKEKLHINKDLEIGDVYIMINNNAYQFLNDVKSSDLK